MRHKENASTSGINTKIPQGHKKNNKKKQQQTNKTNKQTNKQTKHQKKQKQNRHGGINKDYSHGTEETLFIVELTPRSYRATKKPTRWNQHRLFMGHRENVIPGGINTKILQGHKETDTVESTQTILPGHRRNTFQSGINAKILQGHKETDTVGLTQREHYS